MVQIDKLVKIGTKELAKNFDKNLVGVILEPDKEPSHWVNLNCVQLGDMPFNFYITGKSDSPGHDIDAVYVGKVLVRDGHVHFYDRYPIGGGPFEVKDFASPDFRKRAELIVQNIDQLLGNYEEPDFTKEANEKLLRLS